MNEAEANKKLLANQDKLIDMLQREVDQLRRQLSIHTADSLHAITILTEAAPIYGEWIAEVVQFMLLHIDQADSKEFLEHLMRLSSIREDILKLPSKDDQP